jgi:hypothetical protein
MLTLTWMLGLAVVVITAVVFVIFLIPRVSALFIQYIPSRPRRKLFLAAISFFFTFVVARSLAYANYHRLGPFHDIYIRGRHIHHLVWGILILLGVGYGWLAEAGTGATLFSHVVGNLMALLYGAGAALTLDEFALWLNLGDVYWNRQGRASIDAVVLFGVVLLIGIWGRSFLRAVARELVRPLRRSH